jgi:hypothetical protein
MSSVSLWLAAATQFFSLFIQGESKRRVPSSRALVHPTANAPSGIWSRRAVTLAQKRQTCNKFG